MDKTQHNILWQVGLSDGSNHYEGKGDYTVIEGEPSPWRRLLSYAEKRNLKITSLALYTNDGRRWNLPSRGKNPKFKVFAEAEQPLDFRFFRKAAADIIGRKGREAIVGELDVYTVAEAIYQDHKLQLWVAEKPPHASWSLVLDETV